MLRIIQLRRIWPGVLLWLAAEVQAHGLAITLPAHEAVLADPPEELRLVFDEAMTILAMELQNTASDSPQSFIPVDLPRNSLGQSIAHGERITLALPPLTAGTWKVVYLARTLEGYDRPDDFIFTIEP